MYNETFNELDEEVQRKLVFEFIKMNMSGFEDSDLCKTHEKISRELYNLFDLTKEEADMFSYEYIVHMYKYKQDKVNYEW